METKYIISLEIGSSAVSVGAATFNAQAGQPRGPMTMIAAYSEPLRAGSVRYGRIQNVEEVAQTVQDCIGRIAGAPELAGKKITGVYAGIGGRSLSCKTVSVELPLPAEQEVTGDIIERLQMMAEKSVDNRLEILDCIPLSFAVDGVTTRRPVGTFGRRVSAQFTVVVCNPVNSRNLERVVCERCNLDICGLVVRPLAIADLVLSDSDTKPGCMLVDLGAETTTVSIYKEGVLRYLVTVPLGSQHITRDLASGLGVVEAQAEQIKITQGNALKDATQQSPEQREVDNYVQARVIEIIANIVAQIGFSENTADGLRAGIIVTGRGAKLKNFCKLLEVQSHMPVRPARPSTTMRLGAQVTGDPSDLIPLMAISSEGAVLSMDPEMPPCVTSLRAPEPEVRKEEVKAKDADPGKKTALRIDNDEDEPDYTFGGATFGDADPVRAIPDMQTRYGSRAYDEDTLLMDDDEAARKRASDKEKARRQQLKEKERAEAIEEARRRREEEERAREAKRIARQSQPSLWDKIGDRVRKLVSNIDESAGNDD